MQMKYMTTILIFLTTFQASAQLSCKGFYTERKPRTPRIQTEQIRPVSIETSRALDVVKISGLATVFTHPIETKLTWQTFETLKGLRTEVESYAHFLKTLSSAELRREKLALLKHFEQNPELKEMFDKMEQFQKFEYLPAQYELRKRFVEDMIDILKLLPVEFRPKVAKIPWDQRRKNLNRDSVELVENLVKRFDEKFPTTGHANYEVFEKSLRESEDPYIQQALALFDTNQVEIAIRRPSNGRYWIPKTGMHNQYISGSSRGTLSTDRRFTAEAYMTDIDFSIYEKYDNELKPKYGTLIAGKNSGVTNILRSSGQYGPDIYTLKTEAIEDRVTLYIGDSLGKGWMGGKAEDWTGLFIPWKRRLMLVPYIAESLKNGFFDLTTNSSPLVALRSYDIRYWESQTFGRVSLDMVKEFTFLETAPDGEFLAELEKRKIKIYDGRTNPPTLWQSADGVSR